MTSEAIRAMSEKIVEFYRGDFQFPEKCKSNISDMNFVEYLATKMQWRNLQSLDAPLKVDHHLRSSNGYRMVDGLKYFEFVDGSPFALCEESGDQHRFLCVHFQGSSKQHMASFFGRAFGDSISV